MSPCPRLAGKTTLIKALTGDAAIQPRDQLFATLDVTAHAGRLPSALTVLYMDTIGFLSQLPHSLVESFSATLQDVAHSVSGEGQAGPPSATNRRGGEVVRSLQQHRAVSPYTGYHRDQILSSPSTQGARPDCAILSFGFYLLTFIFGCAGSSLLFGLSLVVACGGLLIVVGGTPLPSCGGWGASPRLRRVGRLSVVVVPSFLVAVVSLVAEQGL